jgi:hypothetical protein
MTESIGQKFNLHYCKNVLCSWQFFYFVELLKNYVLNVNFNFNHISDSAHLDMKGKIG